MPEFVPPIFPEGQSAFANWLFSNFFPTQQGGFGLYNLGSAISPQAAQIMQQQVPGLQFGGVGGLGTQDIQGMPLFPGMNPTLQSTFSNWQPWDAGTMFLANMLTRNTQQQQQGNPMLRQLQQWGGTGGPGHQAMSSLMQFGAPSAAGQGAANLNQFGVSSQGSGRPLVDLAYGSPSGAAQYMIPFLTQTASKYKAPSVPQRETKRKAS